MRSTRWRCVQHACMVRAMAAECAHMAQDAEEYCSCLAMVNGVKFYNGLASLHTMMDVHLKREPSNVHDANAILVMLKSGEILGHLEKYATILAPVMDSNLPGLVVKA